MPEFVDVLEDIGTHLIVLLKHYLSQVMDVLLTPFYFIVIVLSHSLHEHQLDLFVHILSCLASIDCSLEVLVS